MSREATAKSTLLCMLVDEDPKQMVRVSLHIKFLLNLVSLVLLQNSLFDWNVLLDLYFFFELGMQGFIGAS